MKMLPEWSAAISVRNDDLDAQHKKLFEIAKRAYSFSYKQATKEEIIKLLRELLRYTQEHFHDEEIYMEAIGFPGLAEHREKHRAIVKEMTEIVKEIKTLDDLRDRLIIITKKWLFEHIIKEDMQYEKFRRTSMAVPQIDIAQEIEKIEEIAGLEETAIKYICNCENKVHLVPYRVHEKIQSQDSVFCCKACKGPIKIFE